MKHIIVYEGLVHISLGLVQGEYIRLYLPWVNKRIDVEGTTLRPPYSLQSGIEWVRSLDKEKGKNEVFAILLHTKSDARKAYRYIGHMGVHDIQWPAGIGVTGSVIGAPNGRGRGRGTEAKLLLMYHSFMVLGLRKLTSSVKAFNGNSLGHLLKCGYKPVGRFTAQILHEGTFVDEILLEVFREDWEHIWNGYQKTKTLPKLTDEQCAYVRETTSA